LNRRDEIKMRILVAFSLLIRLTLVSLKGGQVMKTEPKRMKEQRWIIDNIIGTIGVDWAWPISYVLMGSTIPMIHPMLMMAIKRIKN
jgi:hypothetical protein